MRSGAASANMGKSDVVSADFKKYRVDLHEPVYDSKGVPRADFFAAKDAR